MSNPEELSTLPSAKEHVHERPHAVSNDYASKLIQATKKLEFATASARKRFLKLTCYLSQRRNEQANHEPSFSFGELLVPPAALNVSRDGETQVVSEKQASQAPLDIPSRI